MCRFLVFVPPYFGPINAPQPKYFITRGTFAFVKTERYIHGVAKYRTHAPTLEKPETNDSLRLLLYLDI